MGLVLLIGFVPSAGSAGSTSRPGGTGVLPAPQRSSANAGTIDATGVSPIVAAGWGALSMVTADETPPDVQVAAGPGHVVEAVNLELGVYSKSGLQLKRTNLSVLFATGTDFISDPRVQYDVSSNRWFVSLADISTGQVLLATSKSPDPTAAWWVQRIPSSPTGDCLDQPILGVGALNVIVSANVFSDCLSSTYTYYGAQFWVANKTDLIAGSPSPSVWPSIRYTLDASIHPAQMQGSSPIQYMVATQWRTTDNTANALQVFAVQGSPPGDVSVSETDLAIRTATLAPPADQHGGSLPLDPGDFRIADTVWARDRLWLGFTETCTQPSWTACVRLVEIDTNASAIVQEIQLASAFRNYFYPALTLDEAGDLAVVFGYSSGNDYPGLLATGRLSNDPPGVLQAPVPVVAGSGPESSFCGLRRCRYGDYFGASPDPSDPRRVWLAGELGRGDPPGWGTYIAPAAIKAMITLNYSVTSGAMPPNGPTLRYVLNGSSTSSQIRADPTTFLADPGTSWRIDENFTTPSGDARYVARPSDAANLAGVANRSVEESLAYDLQYPLRIDASAGGTVSYDSSTSEGTVPSGTSGLVYAYPGSVVNLTAHASSLLWVFSGWTGGLTGSAASGSVRIDGPHSVHAAFVLNWLLIGPVVSGAAIAATALAIVLRRRKRKSTPPPPPPSGPAP